MPQLDDETARMVARKHAWCGKGLHLLSPDNLMGSRCRACHYARTSAYRAAVNVSQRDRKLVLDHYGWSCACCGEADPRFLSIDHINGDGAEQRRTQSGTRRVKSGIVRVAILFRKTGTWPDDLQTLCHNCNHAKGTGPVCPHKVPYVPPGVTPLFEFDADGHDLWTDFERTAALV